MATLKLGSQTFAVRALTLDDFLKPGVSEAIDELNAMISEDFPPGMTPEERASVRPKVGRELRKYGLILTICAAGVDGQTLQGLRQLCTGADHAGLWATFREVNEEAGLATKGEDEPAPAPAADASLSDGA